VIERNVNRQGDLPRGVAAVLRSWLAALYGQDSVALAHQFGPQLAPGAPLRGKFIPCLKVTLTHWYVRCVASFEMPLQ
jgi:hypothetical protein